ncbi:unnamed protein product [Didymodactylos carnosus]|uniref:Uncharacterized protein n=1 Tax=Didymodactylos carnosus TaxID=1234261 RepID=A0A814UG79_9BILA|nr:unnamed protein product [Didymodactylos carnosus]CAF3939287.1 unnamed protein product [Didymodactylos carnosus]
MEICPALRNGNEHSVFVLKIMSDTYLRLESFLNYRFDAFIYPYKCIIDLSRTAAYIRNSVLPQIHDTVEELKFDGRQLSHIIPSPTITTTVRDICRNLTSLSVINVEKNSHYLPYLTLFKQLIVLKLYFINQAYISKKKLDIISSTIFSSNSIVETLFIEGLTFCIDKRKITPCHSLKHLTIDVLYQDDMFILLSQLPSVEYLKIFIRDGTAADDYYDYENTYPILLHLKEFILSSKHTICYDQIEPLLLHCPSLNNLSLNLNLDQYVSAKKLEKLIKIPKLDFHLRMPEMSAKKIDKYVNTFKTPAWLNHPVIFYSFLINFCLRSLPFKEHYLHVSNQIIEYLSNISDILLYKEQHKTKIIWLHDMLLKYELIQFIKINFPKLRELSLMACHFDESLMDDINFKMESVRHVFMRRYNLDFKYFKKLLLMMPNIKELRAKSGVLLSAADQFIEDQELRPICEQIEKIIIDEYKEALDRNIDNEMKRVFPNAFVDKTKTGQSH